VTQLNRLIEILSDADIDFVIVETLRELNPTHRQTPQRLSFLDDPARVREASVEIELFGRPRDLYRRPQGCTALKSS
jgi:hypothetical protein